MCLHFDLTQVVNKPLPSQNIGGWAGGLALAGGGSK